MAYQTQKPDDKLSTTPIHAPNSGELDALAVLWAEQTGSNQPLGLSEVHRLVCERRSRFGEPNPAYTTVSTYLRKLVGKGLIRELSVHSEETSEREVLRPTTRSPHTAYQSIYGPAEVLGSTFRALADAYPPERRLNSIIDFANANGISAQVISKMEALLLKT